MALRGTQMAVSNTMRYPLTDPEPRALGLVPFLHGSRLMLCTGRLRGMYGLVGGPSTPFSAPHGRSRHGRHNMPPPRDYACAPLLMTCGAKHQRVHVSLLGPPRRQN